MLQTLPPVAERYGRTQRREIAAAVAAVGRQWRRVGDEFDASYALIEHQLWAVMDTAQERIAAGALEYIPAVLRETGQERVDDPRYDISPRALVGTAGDGLGTDTLAYGAVVHAKTAVLEGASTREALAQGGRFLSVSVGTLLSDTGRTAEKLAAHARPVTGFVRMLEPPSCGRCIILAGKWSRRQEPFRRHPKCDCRNIPASESLAGDLTVSPADYFDGLSDDDLARALGSKANAQAYRDGADPNQLINAYRREGSVREAQVYGRRVKYTTEGITRHGVAGRRLMGTRGRGRQPRLMPESIYKITNSKAEADAMLRRYGWIL